MTFTAETLKEIADGLRAGKEWSEQCEGCDGDGISPWEGSGPCSDCAGCGRVVYRHVPGCCTLLMPVMGAERYWYGHRLIELVQQAAHNDHRSFWLNTLAREVAGLEGTSGMAWTNGMRRINIAVRALADLLPADTVRVKDVYIDTSQTGPAGFIEVAYCRKGARAIYTFDHISKPTLFTGCLQRKG